MTTALGSNTEKISQAGEVLGQTKSSITQLEGLEGHIAQIV
jgi:hypothetical protein